MIVIVGLDFIYHYYYASIQLSRVPPYVTLCIEGRYPFDAEKLLSPRVSVVLKVRKSFLALRRQLSLSLQFSAGDDGYLCAAPDSTAKKALLAAKLGDKCQIIGIFQNSCLLFYY